MGKVYSYEKRRKIIIHSVNAHDGMPVAEVVCGLTQLHTGSPYRCLCWLAQQGDKIAQEQCLRWQALQEYREKRGARQAAKQMGLQS